MLRNSEEWIMLLERLDALFIHDGNRHRPHPLLTSGKHSNGFFLAKLVTENEQLRKEAVSDLLDMLVLRGLDIEEVDRVVGPATGATELAKALAILITRRRGRVCFWGSPEKQETDNGVIMVFNDPMNSVRAGERVLIVEDVMTTRGSVKKTEAACILYDGVILPFVAVLVDRSGSEDSDGKQTAALVKKYFAVWEDEESCDLCRKGSKAISPKRPVTNWALLNAKYPID